jgi:hypothetical protein
MSTFIRDELQQGLVVDDNGNQSFDMKVDGHRVCMQGWVRLYAFKSGTVQKHKRVVLCEGGEAADDDYETEARGACHSRNSGMPHKVEQIAGFIAMAIAFMGKKRTMTA